MTAIVIISDVVSLRQGSPYSIYGYFSIGTSLTAMALFLLMKQAEGLLTNPKIRKAISFISPLTFGIYLLHFIVTIVNDMTKQPVCQCKICCSIRESSCKRR